MSGVCLARPGCRDEDDAVLRGRAPGRDLTCRRGGVVAAPRGARVRWVAVVRSWHDGAVNVNGWKCW